MNIIPVAFAFDNKLAMPACVSITSLLANASDETFYDIFILHSANEDIDKSHLNQIPKYYKNCRIQYRTIGDDFERAYEIRGITTPAYYRLLIPEVIPEYDKVIYADVDIIFRMDLGDLFTLDLGNNYIGAVLGLSITLGAEGVVYMKELGLSGALYFQSGFLLINSALMRSHNLCSHFRSLSTNKYKYQDQDILNISCEKHILSLPLKYNVTTFAYKSVLNHPQQLYKFYNDKDIKDSIAIGNIHYNGVKPWNGWCYNQDIWWSYYRQSFLYNENFTSLFYEKNLNIIDNWSLIKRLKHLFRYFFR